MRLIRPTNSSTDNRSFITRWRYTDTARAVQHHLARLRRPAEARLDNLRALRERLRGSGGPRSLEEVGYGLVRLPLGNLERLAKLSHSYIPELRQSFLTTAERFGFCQPIPMA